MKIRNFALAGSTAAGMLVCGPSASANLITISADYATSTTIPDNDPTGASDTRSISFSGPAAITSVDVRLRIDGGYNGDYYAYLRHGSTGFAVLLNRAGVTASDAFGYADAGFNITFKDGAPNGDIHTYQSVVNPGGSALTGIWQPDGRTADPGVVTDQSSRSAFLSSFNGLDANGAWTLFVADLSPVDVGALDGWGLSVTADVASVPDGALGLAGPITLGLTLLAAALHRRSFKAG